MPYASSPFEQVYLVSDKLQLFSLGELNRIEETFAVKLPELYKAMMTTLGHGIYCDYIRLFSPEQVITINPVSWRSDEKKSARFSTVIPRNSVASAIVIADSIDGDHLFITPEQPEKVYVSLRGFGYRKICTLPRGFRDLMLWIDEDGHFEKAAPIPYFTPWNGRKKQWLFTTNKDIMFRAIITQIERATNARIPLVVTNTFTEGTSSTCLIPEIKGRFLFNEDVEYSTKQFRISCHIEYDEDLEEVAQRIVENLDKIGVH